MSLTKNLIYQTVYQILSISTPLITAPYLARVLGAEQLGIFSYTTSIVAYFSLFAMLGTVNYGTRAIATVKDDIDKCSDTFWNIYVVQAFSSIVMLLAYCFYVINFVENNRSIFIIQGITLLTCLFDINWFFFGKEYFNITVSRNIVVKLVTVLLILLCVKSSSDLYIYLLILLTGSLVGNLILWLNLKNLLKHPVINYPSIIKHFKGNVLLFVPIIAISVYHVMDKTMLGYLSNFLQSGLYYNSDKIINIPICVLLGISNVMLPRMTSILEGGNEQKFQIVFMHSLNLITFLSIAMACGITSVSAEFIPLFLGKGYDECVMLVVIFSPVLIIKGISNTIRIQYLIPQKKEAIFIKSTLIGASVNLLFNYQLIPIFGALGAVVSTMIAEFLSCLYLVFYIKNHIEFKRYMIDTCKYSIIGILMIISVRYFHNYINDIDLLYQFILEVICGFLFLCICSFIILKKEQNNPIVLLIKSRL